MKKLWEKGILPMIASGAVFAVLLVFQSEIRIEDWPLPLALSRIIMTAILVTLIFGFVYGYRRYSAWKKAEAAREKEKLDQEIRAMVEEANAAPFAGHASPAAAGKKAAQSGAGKKETEEKKENGEDRSRPDLNGMFGNTADGIALPEEELDDVFYIRDSRHTSSGPWQQYDYLLASRPYGWGYMVAQADYMAEADLKDVGTVTTAEMANMPETELIESLRSCGNRIADMPELQFERGQLAVGGMSRVLGLCPLKIVWFNQTNVLRIFTVPNNDELLLRYAETVIRRSFGTPDAMKKAKPVPAPKRPGT